jgi:regulator of sirC expression with transglutaminase-like and TPR domain
VDKRIWYDALAACTRLIESEPDRAEYRKDRALLYDQLPQTRAFADADLKSEKH